MDDYTTEMIRDMAFSFCPQCGTAIVPNHKGRPRKFCSPECRSRWNNTHPKQENWRTVRSKICPVCGREFSYRHQYGLERKYCSRAFCSAPFSCRFQGSFAWESELGGTYMKATAELKMLPVSVLKPAAYNPRKKLKPGDKEYEKIKNSITEFGFADPLVVNADMTIIGGHQRLTVAMELHLRLFNNVLRLKLKLLKPFSMALLQAFLRIMIPKCVY